MPTTPRPPQLVTLRQIRSQWGAFRARKHPCIIGNDWRQQAIVIFIDDFKTYKSPPKDRALAQAQRDFQTALDQIRNRQFT